MTTSVYSFFTENLVSEFDLSGCEELIQVFDRQTVGAQLDEEKEEFISNVFTELFFIFEEGKLSLDQLTEFLSRCIKDDLTAEIFCQVLDVLPINTEIASLIDEVYLQKSIIKRSTLVQSTSPDTLLKLANIIPNAASSLNRQLSIRKRDEFYTQKKYNLLHEVSEGYAKLIVEVYQIMRVQATLERQAPYALKIINLLMGHYNLDPNRVLDILIEIFGNQLVDNYVFVLSLLRQSQWWPDVEAVCDSGISELSIGGNETAAKCFGLRFSKMTSDRDLPETFKILLAVLIKEGFISFGSVYKYISDDVDTLEIEYKKDLEDQVFRASASALALAAPLMEEEEEPVNGTTRPSAKDTPSAKPAFTNLTPQTKLEELLQQSQTYQFLRLFLGNGLYYPSIFILTEHPFLALVGEIPVLMNRLTDHVITQFHTPTFSPSELSKLQTPKKVAFSRHNNTIAYDIFPVSSILSFKPTTLSHSSKQFIYFYSEWLTNLPEIKLMVDLVSFSTEFIRFSPLNLAKDLQLYAKLCEIVTREMGRDDLSIDWFSYFRNFLFPPIPLISENSFAIDKAFTILAKFSIEDRFNLYGEMYNVLAKNNPYFKIAYGKAEKSTKDVLKRLSKENVRPMMRRLAKISFTNPLPCFLTILQQIESYDNLNTLVVETARYFNDYGWDNLTLAIMMRLTASGRSVIQEDGLNDRQWIQSLSSFIGKLCQRYYAYINVKTLVTFLLKTLHNGETFGLIVLKEMFVSMGGIQSMNNLTLYQIDMINCGGSLQKVVYRTIDDVRYERFRSGKALVNYLKELDVINELLVVLCQLGNKMIFTQDTNQHLKVLANRDDDLKNVLHLFTELVGVFSTSNNQTDNSSLNLLSIKELCENYQVEPEWAFEIWRNSATSNFALDTTAINFYPCPDISNSFYETFWKLSLYDINFSEDLYSVELSKLKASINSLKDSIQFNSRNKDVPKTVVEKLHKDLLQNESFILKIPEDEGIHREHFNVIENKLNSEKHHWFGVDVDFGAILQYCILPRAIHSPFDAAFCAKFLVSVHKLGAENFNLFDILDQLFTKDILFGTLFTLIPTEAENLGLFYCGILKSLKDEEFMVSDKKKLIYNYHKCLLSDLEESLSTKEYMSRRNAITFLKNLLGVYPTVEDHCEKVVELISDIAVNDERGDLKLSSSALIGHLKSKTKEWVHLWDFIEMSEEEKAEQMKKRDDIKKKEEEKIRKIKEAQELKRKLEEEALKKRREEEAEKKKAAELAANSAKILSYDDSSSNTRTASRNENSSTASARTAVSGRNENSKSRYDYYSKFGEDKKGSAESPSATGTTTPNTRPVNVPTRPSSLSKEPSPPPTAHSDLKSKIKEAKLEYQSKTKEVDSKPHTERSTPQPKSSTSSPVPTGPSGKSDVAPPPAASSKRAPLPPQESIAKPEYGSQQRHYSQRDDHKSDYRQNYHTNYNKSSAPPLPPPTTARPSGSKNPLPPPPPPPRGDSRGYQTYDNRASRSYDQGQGYNRSQGQSYDNRSNYDHHNSHDHRSNYDRRDSYDTKRKQDQHNQGRNDKRQRY